MFDKIKKLLKKILPGKLIKLIKKTKLSANPPIPSRIFIDPVNICNLHCPLCPTGSNKLNYDKSMMSLDTFRVIIKNIPGLKDIYFFNWGEPFLNPDIFKFIRYAKEQNINIHIHSNFSLDKDSDFFINIVESGLDDLMLSIDGGSRESYSKYRVGGDFDLVISNIKRLTGAKKQLKSSKPIVTWKFIVNRFNEGEIKQAKKMAHDLNIGFQACTMGLSDDLPDVEFDDAIEQRKEYWLPKSHKYFRDFYVGEYKRPLYNEPCEQLFNTLFINPDGKIFPCCWVSDKSNVFGDLLKDSIYKIWNNNKYAYSRSLFLHKKYHGPKEQVICSMCDNFKKKQICGERR